MTTTWCGNGWTGQPVVWERPDGVTELMGGAYDHQFHFVDAATGERTRADIVTGDIVKGSPTIDPDGYPLVYFGSRDNRLRIVALDRADPEVIWSYEAPQAAVQRRASRRQRDLLLGMWNDDWDRRRGSSTTTCSPAGRTRSSTSGSSTAPTTSDGHVQVDPDCW